MSETHSEITDKRFPRLLPVPLSQEEMVIHSGFLVSLMNEREDIEEQKRAANTEFKGKLERCQTKITDERNIIQAKAERREVMCVVQIVHENLEHRIIRLDTGEIVISRPLTSADVQGDLLDHTPGNDQEEM